MILLTIIGIIILVIVALAVLDLGFEILAESGPAIRWILGMLIVLGVIAALPHAAGQVLLYGVGLLGAWDVYDRLAHRGDYARKHK